MAETDVKIAEAQGQVEAVVAARMIRDFYSAFRDVYGVDVMTSSLCAVGPLQSMIGLAIKNGHLKLAEKPKTSSE